MSEFLSSFSKWFGEKANSPLYWTYLGFFVVWNWKFFQVIFLEDASLFYYPRLEYLETMLFHPTSIKLIDWLINLIWHIGPPAALTYVAIVWLPKIHHWAFEIYTENLFVRKLAFQKRKVQYEEDAAALTKQEAKAKKVQITQKKEIEKTKTQKERWGEEFNELSLYPLFSKFNQVIDAVYKHSGHTEYWDGSYDRRVVDAGVLAFVHSKDLVNIKADKNNKEIIELTEKGKFFVSKYLEQKS